MGNLTDKESSANVCLHFFIKHLVDKHGYRLMDKFDATIENFELLLTKHFERNQILQFGDLYLFTLANETGKRLETENCLLSPFISRICSSAALEYTSALNNLSERSNKDQYMPEPITYIIAFSQLNWCQVIGILIVKYEYNPFYDRIEPVIEMVCSHQPNTEFAKQRLELANKIKCDDPTKLTQDEQTKCSQIMHDALKQSTVGLGQILVFRALVDLSREGYPFVKLQANQSIYDYYQKKLGFKLGPSPEIHDMLPFKTWPAAALHTREKMDARKVDHKVSAHLKKVWTEFYKKTHKGSLPPSDQALEHFVVDHSHFLHIFNTIYDPSVNMFYKFGNSWYRFGRKELLNTILEYRPNIESILNLGQVFITNDNMMNFMKAVNDSHCMHQFFNYQPDF